jgi:pimeloyl-ACP methyl ester carboxylesterase
MPAVFVHGVPDTSQVWHSLCDRLQRKDVVLLSLPGFGAPLPAGFVATKDAYVAWLLAELNNIAEPVDLIGHDWGALFSLRAASLAPASVRTLAVGGAPLDPSYEWHQTARLWQTPGIGEKVMAQADATLLMAGLIAAGVPDAAAAEASRHFDQTMKDCILCLYRSGIHVGAEWVEDLAKITARGLVLWGDDDLYAAPNFGERLATRFDARFVSYPGCSHWWQLQRVDAVAAELQVLWQRSSEQS